MIEKYNIKSSQIEILKLVIKRPGLSRIEIARIFNLNKSTLSYITKDLEKQNLINFKKEKNSNGRYGSYIYFNYTYEKVLFIEYGKRKIKSFICYLNGQILKDYTINVDQDNDRETLLKDHLIYLKKKYNFIKNCIFAVHGSINIHTKEIKSPFYNIDYKTINNIFKEQNINVEFENESNIYSLGFIDTNSKDIIIDIQIKDGIGGSIIINGELFKGNSGLAGELGHTIAYNNGRPCNCGNLGCLELYASDENTLAECRQKTLKSITKNNFLDYYTKEQCIQKIINRNILLLSKCLNDLCAILNPDIINITSEIYYNIPNIENKFLTPLVSNTFTKPNIIVSNYNINVLIKGFANLYIKQVI